MTRKQLAALKRRKLTRRYLTLRASHNDYGTYTAKQAIDGARNTLTPIKPLDWDYSLERADWKERGFTLHAHVKFDDSPDYSYLGTLNTKWQPRAITVDPEDELARDLLGKREADRPVYFHTETGNGTREFLHVRGVAKGPAEEYARKAAHEEYQRYRSLRRGDWDYVGIVVDASRNGVKLASASLWGIERYGRNTPGFDSGSDCSEYFTETAREVAQEAIAEAEKAIDGLQRGKK